MQHQKGSNKKIEDFVQCPLYDDYKYIGNCIDVQEVAANLILEKILPDEILQIKGFKDICRNCENNLDKNYER